MIAAAVSSGKVSYTDLATTLGLEDLWDVLEIIAVDAHNRWLIHKR